MPADTPPPREQPPCEVTSTRGIFCSRPLGPGLRALSEAGSSSSHHRLPRPPQRQQRHPLSLRPPTAAPGAPRGWRPPPTTKGRAASGGAPEARRVLDALLELHRHGCGGARRSLAGGPRRSEQHPRPARSSRSRPARAALGARPPRIEAAAPPPRPACHRRGMSPKSAARARRRLSRPGSVANVHRPRAPPAVTAGERRQTPLPAARPRLAPAGTPRRPAL